MIGAVDIGGTKIAIGLVEAEGRLVAMTQFPTEQGRSYAEDIQLLQNQLTRLLEQHPASLQGIGIGCTGRVTSSGTFLKNDFLPNWSGRQPTKELEAAFRVGCAIENDADAAALAEYTWGAGRYAKRLIYVTVSTGIGSGMVFDGKLYRGADGSHPEIGHHTIDPSGDQCFCGARGCWERMASGTALAAWTHLHGGDADWDARIICDLAEVGHPLARRAVEREAYFLGMGLANLITLFAPDHIVLGGGLMQRFTLFQEGVENIIRQNCGLVSWQKARVTVSQLQHPGLLGAAAAWICSNQH